MPENSASSNLWIAFALMTVACWGLYGVFLHMGQVGMQDPANGRYKAFFMVGVAYFLIAVLAPAGMLVMNGSDWTMPSSGWIWSLIAGTVGAIGAFCVLLAFGAKGQPAVVMSIIFAGAPIVNAIVVLSLHPPAGGWSKLPWQFFLGIALAAIGGTLVTLYKAPPAAAAATPAVDVPADS
ncbi:MAG: drug/metabolite transporter (DMT)-like permease [Candidatus Paceibacteria bacterium]